MILHHIRAIPNDPDFDYEIRDFTAIYSNTNSLETARSCAFGLAVYDLLDENTLHRLLVEVQDSEVLTTLRNVLDARRVAQNAN